MSEKTQATNDNVSAKAAVKPEPKREELVWPSAATSGGGAYIPTHDQAAIKEG